MTAPYEELLFTVKRQKLKWYGYVREDSQGMQDRLSVHCTGRRRSRQRKRWKDNILELAGLELGDTVRRAKEREE